MKRVVLLAGVSLLLLFGAGTSYAQVLNGLVDGHEWVDLGLPSGTLWATCNVGASMPVKHGSFCSWNDLSGVFDEGPSASWGPAWRLPSNEEWQELLESCKWEPVTVDSDDAYKLEAYMLTGPNGASLYLPAAGNGGKGSYMSGDMTSLSPSGAMLEFDFYKVNVTVSSDMYSHSVRPVLVRKANVDYLDLSLRYKYMGPEGGSFSVKVGSNNSWKVSKNQPWISVSQTRGKRNGNLSVFVKPSTSNQQETAEIVVKAAGGKIVQTITIVRSGLAGNSCGYNYVDLGLPSGTLWATCNVGASKPEELGDYFAWGETTAKSVFSWSNYRYGSDDWRLSKYAPNDWAAVDGLSDGKTLLDASDDAAFVNWGSTWRMPTKSQQDELRECCTWLWVDGGGFQIVGPNGNSIFLPAAGSYGLNNGVSAVLKGVGVECVYWSSENLDVKPGSASGLGVIQGDVKFSYIGRRYFGRSVRAVLAR